MNWPGNIEPLKGKDWHIYTKPEHYQDFENLFKDSPFNLKLMEIGKAIRVAGCGMIPTTQCDSGVILLQGLRNEIAYGIQNQSKMLLAPPDTIFGDGTIPNMLEIGRGVGANVAVAHPRVLPSIIEEIETIAATRGSVKNANLVTLAERHAHDSWKFAEDGHEKNNSFVGGIYKKTLAPGLTLVTHRLPTVYLADFTPPDFDFFWGQVSWGGWDHRWPAENLIRQERMRYVGSSDACFVCEVTEWDKNVPPELPQKPPAHYPPDSYWNGHYHNGINRQFSVIFRGE